MSADRNRVWDLLEDMLDESVGIEPDWKTIREQAEELVELVKVFEANAAAGS